MGLLDSLFSGVKVFVKELVTVVGEAVRVILDEIDRSSFGKAAAGLVQGVTRKYFSQAESLADEERELVEKSQHDGKRSVKDEERLSEIHAERELLRKEMEAAKVRDAAEEFKAEYDKVIPVEMTADELSATVGILASKECRCGGIMRLRQGGLKNNTENRDFYWQCTMSSRLGCKTIKLDANELSASVLRKENPDLDEKDRRQIWARDDVIKKTHGRLRKNHLDGEDEAVVCPHHLLPMKLIQIPGAKGGMLALYEYICVGIKSDGDPCPYTVKLETFPQVSEALRRREGRGIIDG